MLCGELFKTDKADKESFQPELIIVRFAGSWGVVSSVVGQVIGSSVNVSGGRLLSGGSEGTTEDSCNVSHKSRQLTAPAAHNRKE